MYDPHSREPRGFAFVTMDGPEAAEAAIAGMSGVDLLGRTLSVQKVRNCARHRFMHNFSRLYPYRPAVDEHALRRLAGTLDHPSPQTACRPFLAVVVATHLLTTDMDRHRRGEETPTIATHPGRHLAGIHTIATLDPRLVITRLATMVLRRHPEEAMAVAPEATLPLPAPLGMTMCLRRRPGAVTTTFPRHREAGTTISLRLLPVAATMSRLLAATEAW